MAQSVRVIAAAVGCALRHCTFVSKVLQNEFSVILPDNPLRNIHKGIWFSMRAVDVVFILKV